MTHLCQPQVHGIGNRIDFAGSAATPAPEPKPPAEPDRLADWIEEQAAAFKAQQTQAGQWMAETMFELAATARFLGAATPEQFETRKQTLEQERLSVRPCPKVVGRYQAWDVVDGRGKVVRACTDLFDAMMWIQAKLSS
jgi:hypothetical protein